MEPEETNDFALNVNHVVVVGNSVFCYKYVAIYNDDPLQSM